MKQSKSLYLFVLPGLLLYLLFFVYPTINGLILSFTDWEGISPEWNWVGLANYEKMLFGDMIFKKAMVNNLKFMLCVVLFQTVFSLVLAILLLKNSKTNVFLRALYFFPTIISSISVAFIWGFVLNPNVGALNIMLGNIGLEALAQNWLGNPSIAMLSIAFVQIWAHTGQMLVIFVAGLQAIPGELYEAVYLDGANRWQAFKNITWPMVAPAATIVVAYTTIQSFKAFDLIFALTGGGPAFSTEILSTYIYHTAFQSSEFGYAATQSMAFMAIIALITFVQFKLLKGNRAA
ncbi:sugar ABC transporter permease [Paenibacillus validus]|uniref:carbohydrate ABC transporter permease n=1 Tax=Paenibacillus TaxID=44249 RepID=UPI0015805EC7|nr:MULTISPECIES: sugar ABC transporter permease [Paenibacillus]MED4602115.1 sugar ABC transporter permease [Paenibacillus validus]MED4607416.1 sugar ABC transporter permease [Paenibacillus validus]